jgi:ABC-type polar amino acid transport system ATPase subunit
MSEAVLRLDGVCVARGTRRVLENVSMTLRAGELVAIMGPSGSGKTTLLRVIAGLEAFDAGSIHVNGIPLDRRPSRGARASRHSRHVGMVFQFHHLFAHLSVLANVCLAPVHAHGVGPREADAKARALLASLGVEHRAAARPEELSGGEAQRVAIARALAVDPRVLLMDEPTASLDRPLRAELGAQLRRLADASRALLVATHDEDFARQWATRTLRLEHGALFEGARAADGA